jgi:endoribonuclease L-PSP, putative
MKTITTENAAEARGHYAQAVASGGVLYVSGQLPVSVDGTHNYDKPFEKQAACVLANLESILQAGGSQKENLLKVTVYIADLSKWDLFNDIYARFMGEYKPARAVVPVPELHYGYLLEIEAIAKINA